MTCSGNSKSFAEEMDSPAAPPEGMKEDLSIEHENGVGDARGRGGRTDGRGAIDPREVIEKSEQR